MYSASKKREILDFVKLNSASKAYKKYGVARKTIQSWRENESGSRGRLARAAKKAPGIVTGDTEQIRALERENDRLMRFIFKKIVVPMLDEQ